MAELAAVASSDGRVIDLHFGRTQRFFIYERTADGFVYREKRLVEPPCFGTGHDRGRMEAAANALSDCRYVLVQKIGEGAAALLASRGFRIYEAPFPVDDVLEKLDYMLEEEGLGQESAE